MTAIYIKLNFGLDNFIQNTKYVLQFCSIQAFKLIKIRN